MSVETTDTTQVGEAGAAKANGSAEAIPFE